MNPPFIFIKIFISFLCYFILVGKISICQNSISNPSFESGEAGKPDNSGQLNVCDNWVNFHMTPDWYTSKNFPDKIINGRCPTSDPNALAGSILPHSGDYFAGFWPNEGVLNRLNQSVKKNTLVKISFWANLGDNFQTELKVYLCDKAKSIDDINNENNDGKYSGTNSLNYPNDQDFIDETYLVTSFLIDPNNPILNQSPCEWKKYESDWIFVPPIKAGEGNREYDALLIIPTPESGYSKYIFIDDIRLENINPCDHPCGPQGTGATVIEKQPASFSPNGDGKNDTWDVVVSNAIRYKLIIFTGHFGTEVFRSEGEIPNGMEHYKISWDGTFNNGKPFDACNYTVTCGTKNEFNLSIHAYILQLWDCKGNFWEFIARDDKNKDQMITMCPCPPTNISAAVQEYTNTPYFRTDCCVDNIDLKDKIIQNSFTYNAAHIINIENVTVKSGAHVIFNAGDEINRDAETEFEFGSTVEENIQTCIPDRFAPDGQTQSRMARVQEPTEIAKPAVSPVSEKLPNIQSIYPVPANDEIIISLSINTPSEIILKISDITGKTIVLQHKKYFESAGYYSYRISISNLSNGIYLYHLTWEDISKSGKLVVLR